MFIFPPSHPIEVRPLTLFKRDKEKKSPLVPLYERGKPSWEIRERIE